jgi:hypothetical protein
MKTNITVRILSIFIPNAMESAVARTQSGLNAAYSFAHTWLAPLFAADQQLYIIAPKDFV